MTRKRYEMQQETNVTGLPRAIFVRGKGRFRAAALLAPLAFFVWPYHAVIPLNTLTLGQEVELYRFLPPARLKERIAQGKCSDYSLGISRDGVWH